MTKLSAWGNAHHGKITDGVIELPDLSTHTLKNPPEWGHTRLIKFDDLDPIELTQKQKDDLLEKGLEFNDYAILTDGRLYDKSISNDLWLYRAADKKVWRVTVAVTSIVAGTVNVTLNYERFGEFVKKDVAAVQPAFGEISFMVPTTTGDYGNDIIEFMAASPNGQKAIIKITQKAHLQETNKITFIEIMLSGEIDDTGAGLVAQAVEFIDSSTGFAAETTATTTENYTLASIYRLSVNNDVNYPPPSVAAPNSTAVLTRELQVSFVVGPFNEPDGGHGVMVHKFASPGVAKQITNHSIAAVEKVIYDSFNNKVFFNLKTEYIGTTGYEYTTHATGTITYKAEYLVQYDSSGYEESAQRISDSVSGETEYRNLKINAIDSEVFNYDLDRNGAVFSANHAEHASYDVSDYFYIIDGRSATFNSSYNNFVNEEYAAYPHDDKLTNGSKDTAVDLLGVTYAAPDSMPNISRYSEHFIEVVSGNNSSVSFLVESTELEDISTVSPANNLFSVVIGHNLNHADKEQRLMKIRGEIATPEGADNVRYEVPDGEETLTRYYSFNPYSFELVRESPQIVNFI